MSALRPIVFTLVSDDPDSLEQAQAFYSSKAYKDLTPQRDKAQKIIRLYAVEAVQ
jgi:uncharacterized protein (DUF1330 family)